MPRQMGGRSHSQYLGSRAGLEESGKRNNTVVPDAQYYRREWIQCRFGAATLCTMHAGVLDIELRAPWIELMNAFLRVIF